MSTRYLKSIIHFTDTKLVGRIDYALLTYEDLKYLAYSCVPAKPRIGAVPARDHEDQIVMAIERVEGYKLRECILLEVRTCLAYPQEIAVGSHTIVQAHIQWAPMWNRFPEYGKTYRHVDHGESSSALAHLFAAHIAGDLDTVLLLKPSNIRPDTDVLVAPRQHVDNITNVFGTAGSNHDQLTSSEIQSSQFVNS